MKKIDYFTFMQCETLANLDKEFRFTDGIKINSEWYPMPKFGKDKILQLAPNETDRPIKQFDFNSYVKGVNDGYSETKILTNEKHLLNAAKCDLPTYFVSDGISEKHQCYNFGFSVGECYKSWKYICDNINEFAPKSEAPRLSEYGLPCILAKYDAKKLYDNLVNVAFKGSEICFNSWLVNGKPFKTTKLEWIFEAKKGIVSKAQLKMFINTITGDAENTKEKYFKQVFDIQMNTADYKDAKKLKSKLETLIKLAEKK